MSRGQACIALRVSKKNEGHDDVSVGPGGRRPGAWSVRARGRSRSRVSRVT